MLSQRIRPAVFGNIAKKEQVTLGAAEIETNSEESGLSPLIVIREVNERR